ncbi:hypothetical protein U14_03942 [Candidatus Moduliflexus flocculans]|uniref:Citrate transporter-like domain-containing protein n=1 Tax=Candidatus Moduliflexus flocculans TaxID=1499966 RepID=A0A0S6W304_9BACT|nr:hypothetical protein U14_03942 [Candidatus Moduliflexus flocculans]
METDFATLKPLIAIVFVLVYIGLIAFKHKRPYVVWSAIAVLFVAIIIKIPGQSIGNTLFQFLKAISWNVLGIFTGMSIIAQLFIKSNVPTWLADWFILRSRTAGVAMLWLCALSSAISAFVDNVATVLIVAPIALAIAQRLKASPVPVLIGIAISSNLQGMATLVGDPPSMITAGFISRQGTNFGFNEFFLFQGKPSLFFVVQFGAIFGFLVLYWFFRVYRQPVAKPTPVKIESLVPTGILLSVITCLAMATKFDPNFTYFGGTVCILGALIGLLWHYFYASEKSGGSMDGEAGWNANVEIVKTYDIETPLFLAGIFILVFLVEQSGMISDIAAMIQRLFGANLFLTFTMIVWISVLLSGFIDNIPYIMVMLPVTAELGTKLGGSAFYVLAFGLLVGACLGGNCTPVGASANVVTIGLLQRQGYSVSFGEFMKIGVPFTIAATFAGYLFIWFVWS